MKNLALIFTVLIFVFPAFAQEDNQETPPEISPLLLEQLEELDAMTSAMRGLEASTHVDKYFPTREEVTAFVHDEVAQELTEDIILITTLFYRGFDFVSADFDLEKAYLALLADQIVGFYNPDTKEMNVILMSGDELGDRLPALDQITYVHEFVHALQDQHFDLTALDEALPEENWDQILALTSLIEGDATSAMNEYTYDIIANDPTARMEILSVDLGDRAMPEGTPLILEQELLTPYLAGERFVNALREKGDWQAVNEAFANPPVSMEQIFHPEKYFAGEIPVEVTVNDVADTLGAGWEFVAERNLGEFYLSQYLQNELGASIAENAAAGWGGDRFRLYYSAGTDQVAWVAVIAWDAPNDATQFVDAFQSYAERRSPSATQAGACWTAGANALCLQQTDDAHTVIALAPSAEIGAAMIGLQTP